MEVLNFMNFSQKLYYLRTKKKLTQAELAKLSNVSQQSIAHYENGRGIPTMNTILQLSRVFGVKPDDLINDAKSVITE